jgi:hypothetical protein
LINNPQERPTVVELLCTDQIKAKVAELYPGKKYRLERNKSEDKIDIK